MSFKTFLTEGNLHAEPMVESGGPSDMALTLEKHSKNIIKAIVADFKKGISSKVYVQLSNGKTAKTDILEMEVVGKGLSAVGGIAGSWKLALGLIAGEAVAEDFAAKELEDGLQYTFKAKNGSFLRLAEGLFEYKDFGEGVYIKKVGISSNMYEVSQEYSKPSK